MKHFKKISIFSCCIDDWGGSEELWARSIPLIQEGDAAITLLKNRINKNHDQIKLLAKAGVRFIETDPAISVGQQRKKKIMKAVQRKLTGTQIWNSASLENFSAYLKHNTPDLMVIAQGINFDGLAYARACLAHNIPYVLIVQKAVDFYWPQPHEREYMTECFQKAQVVFFVCDHNKRLTEEQFGFRFTNSMMIANPVKIPISPLPFPDVSTGFRLACVGRLFILDKGQDMLLRALSRPAWRSRPVRVSLVGTGVDEAGLKAMAKLLTLDNIDFSGHVTEIEKLWSSHHALVLPSRSEGLPLSILEAMAAGRPAIVTNAGGNAEVVQDGITGFVGEASQQGYEAAMERAWEARTSWAEMGKKASAYILNHVQPDPEKLFAECIKRILYEA